MTTNSLKKGVKQNIFKLKINDIALNESKRKTTKIYIFPALSQDMTCLLYCRCDIVRVCLFVKKKIKTTDSKLYIWLVCIHTTLHTFWRFVIKHFKHILCFYSQSFQIPFWSNSWNICLFEVTAAETMTYSHYSLLFY